MHFIKTFITLSAAAFIALVTSCGSKEDTAKKTDTDELPIVEVTKVAERDVPQMGTYTATVEAFKTNNITTSTPNRIKQILVDVGAHVAKGQKLVVLDNANIDQMKVRLDNTEREYKRAAQLYEIGGGTLQAVEQLKTELDAARSQYENMVENTMLLSPISGVVTARNYDPGDMTGQQPILTVEQVQPVKVIVNVSETDYTNVRKDMPVAISFDTYPDQQFKGSVYLIHPTVDAATRTFTVEITIDNPSGKILPGMFARVEMDFGHAMRVVVPDRAVVKQTGSGNKYVYVYDPATQTVSYNKVELGQRLDDAYELLSGVADGAEVVITGQSRLTNGAKVELNKKN